MDRCLIVILALVFIGLILIALTAYQQKENFSDVNFPVLDLGSSLQLKIKTEISNDIKTKNYQKLYEDIHEFNNLVEALGLRVMYGSWARYSKNEFGLWSLDNIHKIWSLYRLKFDGVVCQTPDDRFGPTYESNYGKEVYGPMGTLKGIWIQNLAKEPYTWVYLSVVSFISEDIDMPPMTDWTSTCYWDIYKQVPAVHKLCFEGAKVVKKVWQDKMWLALT